MDLVAWASMRLPAERCIGRQKPTGRRERATAFVVSRGDELLLVCCFYVPRGAQYAGALVGLPSEVHCGGIGLFCVDVLSF